MIISVCIGSCCHLKGSYDVKTRLQNLINHHGLEEKVTLNVAFCLGRCRDGVTIRIDNEIMTGLTPENTDTVFQESVLCVFQPVAN